MRATISVCSNDAFMERRRVRGSKGFLKAILGTTSEEKFDPERRKFAKLALAGEAEAGSAGAQPAQE